MESSKYKSEINQLNNEKQELQKENDLLKTKIKQSLAKSEKLNLKIDEIRSARSDVHYFEFYDKLVEGLKDLIECPLSLVDITSPIILPSGNTVQENKFNELVARNCLDPFDETLAVRHKIVNRFMIKVKEEIKKSQNNVIKESEKRRAAEEAKIRAQQNSKSVEIQVDIKTRSDDDIKEINNLQNMYTKCSKEKRNLDKQILNLNQEKEQLNQEKEQLSQTVNDLRQDYRDIKYLTPNSSAKFILSMLKQSRGTSAYNSTSLCGYLIFAIMRNQFAVGVCYLIRLMDRLYQQEEERKRKMLEIPKYEDIRVFIQLIIKNKIRLILVNTKLLNN